MKKFLDSMFQPFEMPLATFVILVGALIFSGGVADFSSRRAADLSAKLSECHQDVLRFLVDEVRPGERQNPFYVEFENNTGAVPVSQDLTVMVEDAPGAGAWADGFVGKAEAAESEAETTEPGPLAQMVDEKLLYVDSNLVENTSVAAPSLEFSCLEISYRIPYPAFDTMATDEITWLLKAVIASIQQDPIPCQLMPEEMKRFRA